MRPKSDTGRRLSDAQRSEIRTLLSSGASMESVAATIGCSFKSVQRLLARNGGLKDRPRSRSLLRLAATEREEISRGLLAGRSLRQIAASLGRAPSTISREVKANGRPMQYRAWKAEKSAAARLRRPKAPKLSSNSRLRNAVSQGLLLRWSPQQIAARLVLDYPDDPQMRVSHETIYRSLFVQARGELRKELTAYLRSGRVRRRQNKDAVVARAGQLKKMMNISQRPAEAEDRAIPGHWEGDLIIGKDGASAIGTLVERSSRYVFLLHLRGRTAEDMRTALTRQLSKLPSELRRSLTWDQGKEMAEHARFTVDTNIDVYFCDPHSPWQRGSNENTNGLLRQYFPKGTDLAVYSRAEINAVARELNGRPRQTLEWRTPAEVFNKAVASTL